MKRLIVAVLIALLPLSAFAWGVVGVGAGVPVSGGGTNYLNHTDICYAGFFENNLLDETANDNDLTPSGTALYSDSVCVKQGSYSFYVKGDSPVYAGRTDDDLSAAFPGKSSGGTDNRLTVGCWVRLASTGYTRTLLSKWDEAGNQKSWAFVIHTNNAPRLNLWNSSSYSVNYTATGLTLDTNHNYFVAAVMDGADILMYYAVEGAASLTKEDVGNRSSAYGLRTAPFMVGAQAGAQSHNGYMDEAFVFKGALTESQLNEIYLHGLKGDR